MQLREAVFSFINWDSGCNAKDKCMGELKREREKGKGHGEGERVKI